MKSKLIGRSRRLSALLAIYVLIAGMSFYLSYEVRFDFAVPQEFQQQRMLLLLPVVVIKVGALALAGQFGSMVTFFSLPDLFRLSWAMFGSSLLLLVEWASSRGYHYNIPRGVILSDLLICFAGLCALRLGSRLYRERIQMGRKLDGAKHMEPIAVVGAGDAGASLAKDLLNAPCRGLRPVVFLDDDVEKHGKLVHGVPVRGIPEALPKLTEFEDVHRVVIAIPSASNRRVKEIVFALAKAGYKVETLPSIEELASGKAKATRTRPIEVQDLLGREQVQLNDAAIRQSLEGKTVAVTGAGGSIGSELCRQIARQNPKRLLMIEQSEVSLFVIEQEMRATGAWAIALPLVADILDEKRIDYIFERYKPQIIFHAAAHKHVFMMERQPMEAIHNNAMGTRTIAGLAAKHGVEEFILISTDKAINPTSVMGATKRLAEIHLEALQQRIRASASVHQEAVAYSGARAFAKVGGGEEGEDHGNVVLKIHHEEAHPLEGSATRFMAVRFGNVLGSSGSVVPIFKKQIEAGGPVTVTHPEVTRFFMTIPEAAGLVMQASVMGKGGEIFVLDMGQPVKIVDLAKQMIELSGYRVGEDIDIVFNGLKPGEKLYEELQHRDEQHLETEHPRIMRFVPNGDFVEASERAIHELEERLYSIDNNEAKRLLKSIIPEYNPHWE